MEISTKRLILHALTPQEMNDWVYDTIKLERELNAEYRAEPIEGEFAEILKIQASVSEEDEENYLFHSFWLIIRKTDRIIIGSIVFKDVADTAGCVEVGYGIGKEHEHNGYMSETLSAFCDWALSRNEIKKITAETEINNLSSQKVLKRCGFVLKRREETLWWEKTE